MGRARTPSTLSSFTWADGLRRFLVANQQRLKGDQIGHLWASLTRTAAEKGARPAPFQPLHVAPFTPPPGPYLFPQGLCLLTGSTDPGPLLSSTLKLGKGKSPCGWEAGCARHKRARGLPSFSRRSSPILSFPFAAGLSSVLPSRVFKSALTISLCQVQQSSFLVFLSPHLHLSRLIHPHVQAPQGLPPHGRPRCHPRPSPRSCLHLLGRRDRRGRQFVWGRHLHPKSSQQQPRQGPDLNGR